MSDSKKEKQYICIDLKSFYASVECRQRGLNPLDTNLVVADESRTEKTVCLAVTPSLKAYGISGRARLFEVIEAVKQINNDRLYHAENHKFNGKSYLDSELKSDKNLELDFIIAPPRMRYYMDYSSKIVEVYLKYISADDILVYSVDEVFIDITPYLDTYKKTAWEMATMMIADVFETTGVTATAGIGTNMYLAKIAMDIVAKKAKPDKNGVRIAQLDERKYRELMWDHTPLTDFWRVGAGTARKLEKNGMRTMGDIAACSIGGKYDHFNEDLLYNLFGVNAELLIDHAWGYEPCTIADVKKYEPTTNSKSIGQVLHTPYTYEKTLLIVKEMTDVLVLDLVKSGLLTNQITLTIGYDVSNLNSSDAAQKYTGQIKTDRYGRLVPKHSGGTKRLKRYTSSTDVIMREMVELYENTTDRELLIRRVNVTAENVLRENDDKIKKSYEQLDFSSYDSTDELLDDEKRQRERKKQEALIAIKDKYGKNAILKGMNYEDGATTIDRNGQVGGHKG